MLTPVTAARDMRGDEDARVVPEARVWGMLELAHIDIEGHPPQRSRRESRDQCLLVNDLTPRDVDQDHARLHDGKGLPTDQSGRLRCPLTTDRHGVALLEERLQMFRAFQAA